MKTHYYYGEKADGERILLRGEEQTGGDPHTNRFVIDLRNKLSTFTWGKPMTITIDESIYNNLRLIAEEARRVLDLNPDDFATVADYAARVRLILQPDAVASALSGPSPP